ncbi:MAG: hypothetical protein SGJ27_30915 [Candidatus Melainabacteria bacterium]|nr:hypothetical protein [Candidatus Melainabacteria bacterium]
MKFDNSYHQDQGGESPIKGGDRLVPLDVPPDKVPMTFDSHQNRGGKAEYNLLPSGDLLTTRGNQEALALTSGESVTVDRNRINLTDASGRSLQVIGKTLPPLDIMPSILKVTYEGGVTMHESGGRSIIRYPNGTEVHVDNGKFASVRRDGKTYSTTSEPDTFRGFK